METVTKVIGTVVLTSLIFAVPIFTTLSFVLNWHVAFKDFLTFLSILEWLFLATEIYFN